MTDWSSVCPMRRGRVRLPQGSQGTRREEWIDESGWAGGLEKGPLPASTPRLRQSWHDRPVARPADRPVDRRLRSCLMFPLWRAGWARGRRDFYGAVVSRFGCRRRVCVTDAQPVAVGQPMTRSPIPAAPRRTGGRHHAPAPPTDSQQPAPPPRTDSQQPADLVLDAAAEERLRLFGRALLEAALDVRRRQGLDVPGLDTPVTRSGDRRPPATTDEEGGQGCGA